MAEPTRLGAPTRAPIEVRCDDGTVRRLAAAAVRWNLVHGTSGAVVVGASLALGAIVATAEASPLVGTLVALATIAAQVVSMRLSARRSVRKLAPSGQVLVTRYDDRGRLTFTTAIGTGTLSPGSVDRVEHRGALVHLRTAPGRRWMLLPAQLITAEDTTYLLGTRRTAVPPAPVPAGPSSAIDAPAAPSGGAGTVERLPLLHVVDPQSLRALELAVAGHALRTRSGVFLLACVALTGTGAVMVHDGVTFSLFGLVVLLAAWNVLTPARAAARNRPVGHLIRAAVTPTHLVVDEGDSDSRLPWSSVRTCTTTRGAVILALRQGVVLPLPRSLFPQAELSQLQQLVRQHGGG